jgi:hypothetical protein
MAYHPMYLAGTFPFHQVVNVGGFGPSLPVAIQAPSVRDSSPSNYEITSKTNAMRVVQNVVRTDKDGNQVLEPVTYYIRN